MRKITIALIFLAINSFTAVAQDTLNVRGPLPDFFDWGFPVLLPGDTVELRLMSRLDGEGKWADIAIPMNAEQDTLTVYGIAACLITCREDGWPTHSIEPMDTSYTNVMENLRLYKSTENGGIQQVGEDLFVHLGVTPVSFYMNTGFESRFNTDFSWPILPVYERFFNNPQNVSGVFYVGKMNPQLVYTDYEQIERYPVFFAAFQSTKYPAPCYYYSLYTGEDNAVYSKLQWYRFDELTDLHTGVLCGSYPYVFPILTPGSSDSGDTLSIGDATLQRLTGVLPNPAAEKARVVSSFGMSMVEVFDLNGAAVLKRRTEGLYTDIDVSHWPAGTYLVRIHTPQGVATKKLVVSR